MSFSASINHSGSWAP